MAWGSLFFVILGAPVGHPVRPPRLPQRVHLLLHADHRRLLPDDPLRREPGQGGDHPARISPGRATSSSGLAAMVLGVAARSEEALITVFRPQFFTRPDGPSRGRACPAEARGEAGTPCPARSGGESFPEGAEAMDGRSFQVFLATFLLAAIGLNRGLVRGRRAGSPRRVLRGRGPRGRGGPGRGPPFLGRGRAPRRDAPETSIGLGSALVAVARARRPGPLN